MIIDGTVAIARIIIVDIVVATAAVAAAIVIVTIGTGGSIAVARIVCCAATVARIGRMTAHMIILLQFGQLIFQKFYESTRPLYEYKNNCI